MAVADIWEEIHLAEEAHQVGRRWKQLFQLGIQQPRGTREGHEGHLREAGGEEAQRLLQRAPAGLQLKRPPHGDVQVQNWSARREHLDPLGPGEACFLRVGLPRRPDSVSHYPLPAQVQARRPGALGIVDATCSVALPVGTVAYPILGEGHDRPPGAEAEGACRPPPYSRLELQASQLKDPPAQVEAEPG